MKKLLFIFIFVFQFLYTWATDHYGISGTTWGAGGLLTWAASSGGVGTLNDPTASDNVILDGNSSSVVCSGSPVGLSLTTTGYNGTISGVSILMVISGSVTLSSTTTITLTRITINATSTFTQNSATISCQLIWSTAATTHDISGALTTSNLIEIDGGTWNTNNNSITVTGFFTGTSAVKTINLGSSVITLTGTSGLDMTASNVTLNASTSAIKFTSTSNTGFTFAGNSKTFYDVWFSRGGSTGTITITGTNTFHDLKDDGTGTHTITFPNVTTTVTTFSVSGTSGHLITLQRTGGSGTWTISQASGAVCRDYLSISNSTATGGATWNAGANSTDGGGNTTWVFAACSSGSYRFFFKP